MIVILALVIAGLLLPFMFIFGPIVWLMWVPIGSLVTWAAPHWQRLPAQTRTKIRKTLIWTSSGLLWFAFLRGWGASW